MPLTPQEMLSTHAAACGLTLATQSGQTVKPGMAEGSAVQSVGSEGSGSPNFYTDGKPSLPSPTQSPQNVAMGPTGQPECAKGIGRWGQPGPRLEGAAHTTSMRASRPT